MSAVGFDDVVDMFEAPEAIECGVVHIVAGRATRDELFTLRSLVRAADRARAGTDREAFLRDDHAIHAMLVRLVRNSLLQDPAGRLLARTTGAVMAGMSCGAVFCPAFVDGGVADRGREGEELEGVAMRSVAFERFGTVVSPTQRGSQDPYSGGGLPRRKRARR